MDMAAELSKGEEWWEMSVEGWYVVDDDRIRRQMVLSWCELAGGSRYNGSTPQVHFGRSLIPFASSSPGDYF